MQRWIALVGMMGCGKSAVGRLVAHRLGAPFVDADEAIERAAGRTIAEIFERDGEAFFREREREVVARLLTGPPGVLATGGGTWTSPANRAAIEGAGVAVWLDADPAILWRRVSRQRGVRPLLDAPDPLGRLRALHAERAATYALAPIRVTSGDRGAGAVADEVIAAAGPAVGLRAAS